jgi:hypothetical protein
VSTQTAYADVEIRILERQDKGYPVDLTVNFERQYQGLTLDPAQLPPPLSGNPQQDGEQLFQWFCADVNFVKAWAEVRGAYPNCRLRLRIDATAPELHALPWESLREVRDGQIAQDLAASVATPFSRYLAGTWQPGSPILTRPIRILGAIANPDNLAEQYKLQAVEIEHELALLQAATAGLAVELVVLPQPCTLTALGNALKAGIHILHFIGHGSYSQRTQEAALLMADEHNQVRLVKDSELAELLVRQLAATDVHNDDKLRLVFLASCQTATRSPADAFRGFAPRLIQAGVPAVLAMQDLVPVATARAFAQTFYQQLLQHGQVDLACNEARATVISDKLAGATIPVLFMRLRNGLLLTEPGQISRVQSRQPSEQPVDQEEEFWQPLLRDIFYAKCIPFLGPQVLTGLLPDRSTLAARLAEEVYPGAPDQSNLVRVAQYAAINDPGGLRDNYLRLLQESLLRSLGLRLTRREQRQYADRGLSALTTQLQWSTKVRELDETEVHHLLAALELPLYITTNPDSFMTEALKAQGKTPRRVGLRWAKPQAGTPQWVLTPDPSADQPVVFHLAGFEGDLEQQQNLVLSEDDYMAFLVRLSRDQEQLLPSNLLTLLSTRSFLFLGYQLEDWEFRIILLSILKQIDPAVRKMHVGVQLDPAHTVVEEKVRKYLELYLTRFNIAIYWGTPKTFMSELHNRWQQYLASADDN